MQNPRYWIEHAFHEAKSQLGNGTIPGQGIAGLVPPYGTCLSADGFHGAGEVQKPREIPLRSYRDIVELLDYYLPRRNREEKVVHEQIKKAARSKTTGHEPTKTTQVRAQAILKFN